MTLYLHACMQAVIQVVVKVPGIANQLKIITESLKNKEHMYGKAWLNLYNIMKSHKIRGLNSG